MATDLDKLLNDYDEKSKKLKLAREKQEADAKTKKETFSASFKDLLAKKIKPEMTKLLDKIHAHGHATHVIDDKMVKPSAYPHMRFMVNKNKGAAHVLFSFVGNHDHQKVFVHTEYADNSSAIRSEKTYDVAEITAELLGKIVVDGLSKILK